MQTLEVIRRSALSLSKGRSSSYAVFAIIFWTMVEYARLAPCIKAIVKAYHTRGAIMPAPALFMLEDGLDPETRAYYFRDYLHARWNLGPDRVHTIAGENLVEGLFADEEAQACLRGYAEARVPVMGYVGCRAFARVLEALNLGWEATLNHPLHPCDDKLVLRHTLAGWGLPKHAVLPADASLTEVQWFAQIYTAAWNLIGRDWNSPVRFCVKLQGGEGGAGNTGGITIAELTDPGNPKHREVMAYIRASIKHAAETGEPGLGFIVEEWLDKSRWKNVTVMMTDDRFDYATLQGERSGKDHFMNAETVGEDHGILDERVWNLAVPFVQAISNRVAASEHGPIRGPHGYDLLVNPESGEVVLLEINARVTASRPNHLYAKLLYRRRRRSVTSMMLFLEDVPDRDLRSVIRRIDEAGLALDPSTWNGVVVSAPSTVAYGKVTVMITEDDFDRARATGNVLCRALGVEEVFTDEVTDSFTGLAAVRTAA